MLDNGTDDTRDSSCLRDVIFDCGLLRELWRECLIGVAILDKDGKFLFVNPSFCEIVEYSEVELQDRNFQSITHPDDVESDTKLAAQTSGNQREKYYMVKRYITKRGRVVTAKLFVNPIKRDGEFVYFLSQIIELKDIPNAPTPQYQVATPAIKNHWKAFAALGAYVVTEIILKLTDN